MTGENLSESIRRKSVLAAFQMPSVQTMVSRKSSITNAFVSAIIPVVPPTDSEVEQALRILNMVVGEVVCAYCGDRATEWDHLRPLVLNRRPTGFISEIANLVPACGKCNQSKGNKPWRSWMISSAKLSPTGRGVRGVEDRAVRLEAYEQWIKPTKIDFVSILGPDKWEKYWASCEGLIEQMRECQKEADQIRIDIARSLASGLSDNR